MVDATSSDDLFRPSLQEADDAVGFDRPWNPTHLVYVTFFAGIIAGGALLAMNFRRLGLERRFWPAVWLLVAATLIIYGGMVWWVAPGAIDPDDKRLMRFGARGAGLVVALFLAHQQRQRWRLFEMAALPRGKLLWPALAAFVVGAVITFVLVLALTLLASGGRP